MLNEIDTLLSRYESGAINRRQLLAALAIATAATSDQSTVAESPAEKPPAFQAKSLNHVTLSVTNVARSQAFYESVLGISVISRQSTGVNLGLGDSFLGLYPINEPPRINHFCVGLDDFQVQVAADRLKEFGIKPRVRQDKPEVYFRDPDGISVQLEHRNYRG